jgi:hypothetical protein
MSQPLAHKGCSILIVIPGGPQIDIEGTECFNG